MHKKVIVVMPAYNVGKKIISVYDQISPEIMDLIDKFIIIVDGATDDTLEKARKIKERVGKVIIIIHPKNKGYGAALKTGFNKALEMGAEACIELHSDGQMDTKMIPRLIQPLLEDSADMVIGSRMLKINPFKTPMPFYKYCGNKFLTFLENLALGSNISEFHTGYITYSQKTLRTIKYQKLDNRFNFDGHMIIMALINELRVKEVPVPVIYNDEKSHLGAFSYGLDVLKTIWKYKMGYFHKLK